MNYEKKPQTVNSRKLSRVEILTIVFLLVISLGALVYFFVLSVP